MTACDDIRARCHPYLDGELEAGRRAEVDAHLAACEACATHYAGERALLRAVAEKGRERAPAVLRERVEALLAEPTAAGAGRSTDAASARPRRAWAWVAVPLAASIALLIVSGPWRSDAPSIAAGLAADHLAHAETAPGPPLSAGDPRPPIAATPVSLARCTIEGRPYLHYVYREGPATISVFVPMPGVPVPPAGGSLAIGAARVMTVENGHAVLVADGVSEEALTAFWRGA